MRKLVVAVLALAGPAAAQPADPGAALVQTFELFCLQHFPEPARIEDAVKSGLTPLPPREVRRYLHDDPGHGWEFHDGEAAYIVTIEEPPYHTCAVRRLFATAPDYAGPYAAALRRWAQAGGHGAFQPTPRQTVKDNGLVIDAGAQAADDGRGDTLMDLRTTYPNGSVEERLARRAVGR